MKFISPSILNADFFNLPETLEILNKSGIKLVHLDVMDGVFVPNLTFGPHFIKQLSRHKNKLKFMSHLMIVNPEKYIKDYADAGSDGIIIHQEASVHLHRTLSLIKSFGIEAGVALNPSTPISSIVDVLELLDEVLIMSVNPGFGGQAFIEESYRKIEDLVNILEDRDLDKVKIAIDGGVNESNLERLFDSGLDIAIIGSAIFKQQDLEGTIKKYQEIAERF